MLTSLVLSFTKYNVMLPPEFVGFGNYVTALTRDELVFPSIARTFYYARAGRTNRACALPRGRHAAESSAAGDGDVRTFFFLPTLTPVVAAALLWRWMLNPDVGIVNYSLAQIGIRTRLACVDAVGYPVAGADRTVGKRRRQPDDHLPGRPAGGSDRVVGGSGNRSRRYLVQVPERHHPDDYPDDLLQPRTGDHLRAAYIRGGLRRNERQPARATWFISLHIYQNAFVSFDMGYASALAWLFLIVLLGFTYLQFRISGRWVYYASERGS